MTLHPPLNNEQSDVLTRQYWLPPSQLPWSTPNMTISEQVLDMSVKPGPSLPDSDKKQILMAQQTTVEQLSPGEPAGHIMIQKNTDGTRTKPKQSASCQPG